VSTGDGRKGKLKPILHITEFSNLDNANLTPVALNCHSRLKFYIQVMGSGYSKDGISIKESQSMKLWIIFMEDNMQWVAIQHFVATGKWNHVG
jgi:hypothetical protein